MFSCGLKFVIDILRRWLGEKFFWRLAELDVLTKHKFKGENPSNWQATKCCICNLKLAVGSSDLSSKKISPYFDYAVSKEHAFIRNIFDPDELKTSKNIETLKKYHGAFRQFVQIVTLLNSRYSKESDIEEISDDCIVNFLNENNFESFAELFERVEKTEIKKITIV